MTLWRRLGVGPKEAGQVPAYRIDNQRLTPFDAGFADALATAYVERLRPLCLCLAEGVAMYVARLGASFIVKRMPGTGSMHATDCVSYELPAELSGLAHVIGSAITENPETGITSLKLGFAMSKNGTRSIDFQCGDGADSAIDRGAKLTLRGLLHYLWDQAELTRWHPGFAGRRSWATVRRHLYSATEGKIARGRALHACLYIPEVFNVERRDELTARRSLRWTHAMPTRDGVRQLMLMVGEVKEIMPTQFGFNAMIKHVPDQPFALSGRLYESIGRRFEQELSLWGACDGLHMVMIATFGLSDVGIPTIEDLSLMPTSAQWIPVEDVFELQLVNRLLRAGRRFSKSLRYDFPAERDLTAAVLLDTPDRPSPLCIARPGYGSSSIANRGDNGAMPWVWDVGQTTIPPLPLRA